MTSTNLRQFNSGIDRFAKSIPDKITILQKKIVMEALRRLVQKTPVRTGRARGNWQPTIGIPAENELDTIDKQGQAAIAKGLAILAGLKPYDVVYISNNVNYIMFLEHGSSKQAPAGMLSLTIEELRQQFRNVLK